MATRSLLVSYMGYPSKAFSFLPDNGLANLAACLIQEGHETLIWDCSTVSAIGELYPYELRDEMKGLSGRIMQKVAKKQPPDEPDLRRYHALEERMDRYQDEKVRELGRRMADYVTREGIHFVGFKLWTGAGFAGSTKIAEEIRRQSPATKLYGGGPHVDWFMERCLDATDALDAFIYGEGEDVIVQLAEHAEGKRPLPSVANAIYRDNGSCAVTPQTRVETLADLPLPCYDVAVYPALNGDDKIKMFLLDESRGCPNNCHFCIHPLKSGRRRRTMDAAAFVDRLEGAIRRYGFRHFRFAGSNPPAGLRNEIAGEILRRGLTVAFTGFAHAKGAQQQDFGLLRDAGCRALSFGVESGSQEILDRSMNKHVKVEEIRESLNACKNAGIATVASVIVPAPHETDQTKEETYRLLLDVRPDSTIVSFPAMVFGTTWERENERFGFRVNDKNALAREGMTHTTNIFAPPALWRPLKDYELNGKSFQELGQETAEFVLRLKGAGLLTQVFDQEFLMAEMAGMAIGEFERAMSRNVADGEVGNVGELVSSMNRQMSDGREMAARK